MPPVSVSPSPPPPPPPPTATPACANPLSNAPPAHTPPTRPPPQCNRMSWIDSPSDLILCGKILPRRAFDSAAATLIEVGAFDRICRNGPGACFFSILTRALPQQRHPARCSSLKAPAPQPTRRNP